MKKLKFSLIFIFALLFLLVAATAVIAQDVPAPYAGLKNLFAWDDASAQTEGKKLYQQYCTGCHGAKGSNIAAFDFSTKDFHQSLEESPDFSFWILSEGRLNKGMPPYKSSLSEEQRWQVLTYIWSLGTTNSSKENPTTQPPPEEGKATLLLTVPAQARSGQPVTISATLRDEQGKPIPNAPVKFFVKVEFFASGLMEIGEAITNDNGVATLEPVLRQTGDTQVVAHYERNGIASAEAAATVTLAESSEPFYQPDVGIHLPAPGKEVFIGPKSALELGQEDTAPTSAFRLPGGILSWLLFLVAILALIWFTYFRVMYQVFRIPIASEIRDTDTRLVPLLGLAIVLALGVFLIVMLITGPYSHFHLLK